MANYVTHIAEIDPSDLSARQLEELRKITTSLNGKLFFERGTSWAGNPDIFKEVAAIMDGKPFKAMIYDEDPGSQVAEGVVNDGKGIGKQLQRFKDYSPEAIKKHDEFAQLSDAIYEGQKKNHRLKVS
jgi:hypothetical protein